MNNSMIPVVLGVLGSTGVQYETPDYLHSLSKGARPALAGKITTSGKIPMWGIVDDYLAELYDGSVLGAHGYMNNLIDVVDEWMEIDLLAPVYLSEIKITWTSLGTPAGVWKVQGLVGASWLDDDGTFTLGDTVGTPPAQVIPVTDKLMGCQKYRLAGVSGQSDWNLYYWAEMEFKYGSHL